MAWGSSCPRENFTWRAVRLGETIVFTPVQPGFLHRGDVAAVIGGNRVDASEFALRLEPVAALRPHPFQNQGHNQFSHAYDLPMSRMLSCPS